jgi:carbon storage regulator CsrA
MLVLTRKLQEKIRIGDNITITILRTKGKAVRLGIEAPMEVPVIRGELAFDHGTFTPATAGAPSESDLEEASSCVEPGQRPPLKSSPATPFWELDSRRGLGGNRLPGSEATRISLQRVPREQVGQLADAIQNPGRGPLRAMLDRRSLTA